MLIERGLRSQVSKKIESKRISTNSKHFLRKTSDARFFSIAFICMNSTLLRISLWWCRCVKAKSNTKLINLLNEVMVFVRYSIYFFYAHTLIYMCVCVRRNVYETSVLCTHKDSYTKHTSKKRRKEEVSDGWLEKLKIKTIILSFFESIHIDKTNRANRIHLFIMSLSARLDIVCV